MVRYGDILSAGEDALEIASLGGVFWFFSSFSSFPSNRFKFYKIKLMSFLVNFTERKEIRKFHFNLKLMSS